MQRLLEQGLEELTRSTVLKAQRAADACVPQAADDEHPAGEGFQQGALPGKGAIQIPGFCEQYGTHINDRTVLRILVPVRESCVARLSKIGPARFFQIPARNYSSTIQTPPNQSTTIKPRSNPGPMNAEFLYGYEYSYEYEYD